MELTKLYELRQSFSIIGITGRTGSGCTKLAQILSSSFEEVSTKYSLIRKPEELTLTREATNRNFIQKYKVAYNYSSTNWKKYIHIEYKNILYAMLIFETIGNEKLLNEVFKNCYKIDEILENNEAVDNAIKLIRNFQSNLKFVERISFEKKLSDELMLKIWEVYDSSKFKDLLKQLNSALTIHYFERTLLLHRIGDNYRTFGTAYSVENENSSLDNIYTIIQFINGLIKQIKSANQVNSNCHIVIDSLRNSMEIMFLKERYSAFNMIAVKGESRRDRLKRRIEKIEITADEQKKLVDNLIELDNIEYRCNDYKKGSLGSPDVQNCIAQSDIHVFNADASTKLKNDRSSTLKQYGIDYFNKDKTISNRFFSLGEQVLKFQALIQQPGIITPSSTERCMQIAYSAKLNSGCISRQVGAVVTDKNFSIKSVGWNDVPSGATPCNLRDIRELEEDKIKVFTDFEKGVGKEEYETNKSETEESHLNLSDSKKFKDYLLDTYQNASEKMSKSGKPCSFCFKSAYNKFSGEDNQVHTRSLHAEENAMLQISKYGGIALEGGNLFTTASPCELCSKKAYQLGIRNIYYIDPYPGISLSHVLKNNSSSDPIVKFFQGAVGRAYHRLYEPFMAYKDELAIETGLKPEEPLEIQIKELVEVIKKNTEKNKLDKDLQKKIDGMSKSDLKVILTKLIDNLGNKDSMD